jgi:branched-chain amino acid transport system substrate-binding protein
MACGSRTATDSAAAGPGITDDTVKIGGSFPLSGPLSASGQAQLAGLQAAVGATNDAGGVAMADGRTRKIDFVAYDDGYEPARAVQNFRRLVDQDQVLAYVGSLGTATNAAVLPVANQQGVPQVFLASGASQFSADRTTNKWTVGWIPTYKAEGAAFGRYLAGLGKPLTVATLSQNDDLGKDYVAGLEEAITGSQVTIVARQTHERTDVTLDSQVATLAQSKADVLFTGLAIPRLQASALQRMQQLDWRPITYLNLLTAGITEVITPSGIEGNVPDVLSAGFAKVPDDPTWTGDAGMAEYLARMQHYSPNVQPSIPNAVWGYSTGGTLLQTLTATATPTRQGLMDAIGSLKPAQLPMLLPGLLVAGGSGDEPVVGQVRIQHLVGGRWAAVG